MSLRRRGVVRAWRALTNPLTVFLLHAAALWIVPTLYTPALAHAGVHAAQHVSFVVAAALFWWGMVHGRYGRIGYRAGVLYVFLTALQSSVLGALLAIAPVPWYPDYTRSATSGAWMHCRINNWHPQAIERGTAIPDMNVSDQDARDITAYLYTLR